MSASRQVDRPARRRRRVPVEMGKLATMTRELPHHGRWFEELAVGDVVVHALTRTVTETDNILMTTLTLNPARLHLDAEYSAETEFGRPLVNSMFTLALLVGMSDRKSVV